MRINPLVVTIAFILGLVILLAVQYDRATWAEAGGTGVASDHSYEHQRDITRAFILKVGWGRWPKCSRLIGAR